MVKQKLKKQNVTKYATWNVRGITHKEEELDSALKQKQTEVAAIMGGGGLQWKQIITQ